MYRGKYIVLEGLECSGKSTQAHKLVTFLGPGTLHVREPGGTYMGEQLRAMMKIDGMLKSPRANMFLFMSARANLADLSIRPTINSGNNVVSDRNWLSTLAYQTVEGAPTDQIVGLSQYAMGEFAQPDLLILIDTAAATCLKRARARVVNKSDQYDYFGKGALGLFRHIRENYLQEVSRFSNGVIVDGNLPPNEVWQQIEDIIKSRLSDLVRT